MAEGEAINCLVRGQAASQLLHSLFISLCVVPEQKSLTLSRKANPTSPGKAAFPPVLR